MGLDGLIPASSADFASDRDIPFGGGGCSTVACGGGDVESNDTGIAFKSRPMASEYCSITISAFSRIDGQLYNNCAPAGVLKRPVSTIRSRTENGWARSKNAFEFGCAVIAPLSAILKRRCSGLDAVALRSTTAGESKLTARWSQDIKATARNSSRERLSCSRRVHNISWMRCAVVAIAASSVVFGPE